MMEIDGKFWEKSLSNPTKSNLIMAVETDDHGRLYLPKDLRDKHGERFRVLDLPRRVVLIPIDEDPLQAVRDSIGERFEGRSFEDLRADIEEAAKAEVAAEVEEREQSARDE